MKTASFAAFAAAVLACSGAGAAEKRALYDRASVSLGALAARAEVVATARSLYNLEAGEATIFGLALESLIKGQAPPEVRVVSIGAGRLCDGEHLVFLEKGPDGSWALSGGIEFGWVHLRADTRTLALETAAAHAAGDREAMAEAAGAALEGGDSRLAGDAAVDLFNEPSLVPLLGAGARKAVARLVGTPGGRETLAGEWPYLAVSAGRIGDEACVAALLSAARDKACLPRAFALGRAFSFVGKEGRAALLEAFTAEKNEEALPGLLVALSEIRLEAALPKVLALAASTDPGIRKFALVAAGDLGGPLATAFLKGVLHDAARPLVERKLAVVALAARADPEGIKAVVAAEKEIPDPELVKFIAAFRKDPASERLQLLRSALSVK